MDAHQKLEDLYARRSIIESDGAKDSIDKHDSEGKLSARQRLRELFDENTFVEIDAFVKMRPTELDKQWIDAPAEGVVTGYGAVDGRLCFAYSQDAAVIDGSVGEMHAKKIVKIIDHAVKMGAPVIGIFDSKGMRLSEGIDALNGYSLVLEASATASGVIPQISVICGLCAGGLALAAANSDFTIMTKYAEMFITSPIVLSSAFNQDVTQIGNAQANAANGNAHFICDQDAQAMHMVRSLLTYLPSNNLESAPYVENDDMSRICPTMEDITKIDDMYSIIEELVDKGSFIESQNSYGNQIITGFARIGGESIGIVANNGDIVSQAAAKAARFINVCDSFNIPIITLVNTNGLAMDVDEEKNASVRSISRMICARASATCVKITVILKNAYGSAYAVMTAGSDSILAWPYAEIGAILPDAASVILYADEIESENDPIAARKKYADEYRNTICTPYEAAKRGYIDDVIDPKNTRQRIASSLMMFLSKHENTLPKKHINMPI